MKKVDINGTLEGHDEAQDEAIREMRRNGKPMSLRLRDGREVPIQIVGEHPPGTFHITGMYFSDDEDDEE